MGEFPNTATQFKTGEQQVEIARRGGSVSSPKKSLAARLRNLKRTKKITPEKAQYLYEMMTDPETANYHVFNFITELIEERRKSDKPLTVAEGKELARLKMEWVKMQHGTKETKHTLDVTSKEYKFVIEVQAQNTEPVKEDVILVENKKEVAQ